AHPPRDRTSSRATPGPPTPGSPPSTTTRDGPAPAPAWRLGPGRGHRDGRMQTFLPIPDFEASAGRKADKWNACDKSLKSFAQDALSARRPAGIALPGGQHLPRGHQPGLGTKQYRYDASNATLVADTHVPGRMRQRPRARP